VRVDHLSGGVDYRDVGVLMFTPIGQETPDDIDDRIAELAAAGGSRPRRQLRLASELSLLIDSFAERMAKGAELLHQESDPGRRDAIVAKVQAMQGARSRAMLAVADAYWGEDLDQMRLEAAKTVFGAVEVKGGG
jgi:hypothetical protein